MQLPVANLQSAPSTSADGNVLALPLVLYDVPFLLDATLASLNLTAACCCRVTLAYSSSPDEYEGE